MTDWKYYNHALIPTCAPHETPDLTGLENGSAWKGIGKKALLARWTTEYDAPEQTNWWYVVKDTPFDIAALRSNRRYKLTKGEKYFEVKRIDPLAYKEALFSVLVDAFGAYPAKYRPTADRQAFFEKLERDKERPYQMLTYGAFLRETNELCGFARIPVCGTYAELQEQKTKPQYEKLQVNAALVYGILQDCQSLLKNGIYLCDGARSISHETAFQDYLEKYFGFRKAYCRLHIQYNPKVKWLVGLLYPFRKLLAKLDGIKIVHQLNGVLKMEEIVRNGK